MTALDELTKESNWDYEEQYMDGAPLGYTEVYYVGDPVFAQAKLELAALREAGEKMAERLRENRSASAIANSTTQKVLLFSQKDAAALAEWEAANK